MNLWFLQLHIYLFRQSECQIIPSLHAYVFILKKVQGSTRREHSRDISKTLVIVNINQKSSWGSLCQEDHSAHIIRHNHLHIYTYLISPFATAACMGRVLVLVRQGSAPACIRISTASGFFLTQAKNSGVSPLELGQLTMPDLS